MRIFVAGATGAVGKQLVPRLVREGHEVIGLARDAQKVRLLESWGAHGAIADPFDRVALTAAIQQSRPEVIVHELTAIPGNVDLKRFDQAFATTNRIRSEVAETLAQAARAAGARQLVAQSFCGWTYARGDATVKMEADALDANPPAAARKTLEAIRFLEDMVTRGGAVAGVALRYGWFYGPGTSIAHDGEVVKAVLGRKLPIVGGGAGVWSFIHIADAAEATVAAISRGAAGIYNIVDDEPAPVSEWLPALARAVGAPPPYRVPAWLARFAIGELGVSIMTSNRGASNAKARRELAWAPRFSSWRRGFAEGL